DISPLSLHDALPICVRVRVVDKKAEPETTSRAVAVQARTLELYGQTGLAGAVVERGRKLVAANLWVAGKNKARMFFGDLGAGLRDRKSTRLNSSHVA